MISIDGGLVDRGDYPEILLCVDVVGQDSSFREREIAVEVAWIGVAGCDHVEKVFWLTVSEDGEESQRVRRVDYNTNVLSDVYRPVTFSFCRCPSFGYADWTCCYGKLSVDSGVVPRSELVTRSCDVQTVFEILCVVIQDQSRRPRDGLIKAVVRDPS